MKDDSGGRQELPGVEVGGLGQSPYSRGAPSLTPLDLGFPAPRTAACRNKYGSGTRSGVQCDKCLERQMWL